MFLLCENFLLFPMEPYVMVLHLPFNKHWEEFWQQGLMKDTYDTNHRTGRRLANHNTSTREGYGTTCDSFVNLRIVENDNKTPFN